MEIAIGDGPVELPSENEIQMFIDHKLIKSTCTYITVDFACELRPESRTNVNKYTFMTLIFCRLRIH